MLTQTKLPSIPCRAVFPMGVRLEEIHSFLSSLRSEDLCRPMFKFVGREILELDGEVRLDFIIYLDNEIPELEDLADFAIAGSLGLDSGTSLSKSDYGILVSEWRGMQVSGMHPGISVGGAPLADWLRPILVEFWERHKEDDSVIYPFLEPMDLDSWRAAGMAVEDGWKEFPMLLGHTPEFPGFDIAWHNAVALPGTSTHSFACAAYRSCSPLWYQSAGDKVRCVSPQQWLPISPCHKHCDYWKNFPLRLAYFDGSGWRYLMFDGKEHWYLHNPGIFG